MKPVVGARRRPAAVDPMDGIFLGEYRPRRTVFAAQAPSISSSGSYPVDADDQSIGSLDYSDPALSSHSPLERRRTFGLPVATGAAWRPSSDYASDDQESDADAKKLWHQLDGHRVRIKAMRKEIAARRKSLRVTRKQLAEADNMFMATIRNVVFGVDTTAGGLHDDTLFGQWKSLRDMRTKHGPNEYRLEQLEDELEWEEHAAERAEDAFFRHIYREPLLEGDGSDDGYSSDLDMDAHRPGSRTSLLGIPGERPVDMHPAYVRLMSAIGEKESEVEYYHDLLGQRDMIIEDIERRRKIARRRDLEKADPDAVLVTDEELDALRDDLADLANIDHLQEAYGIEIAEHDLGFLRTYPDTEQVALELISAATLKIERLRTLCIEQGGMPKHPTLEEEYTVLAALGESTEELLQIDLEMDAEPSEMDQLGGKPAATLAHPRFQLLLSNPKHVLELKLANAALRDAIARRTWEQSRGLHTSDAQLQVQMCIKELSIEGLMSNGKLKDKAVFINHWLLQRLRTTPLEVQLLLNVFSSTLKLRVKDVVRWQQDVLYFWMRDKAAVRPPSDFDGPVTVMSSVHLDDLQSPKRGAVGSRNNSAAEPLASVASDIVTHRQALLETAPAKTIPHSVC